MARFKDPSVVTKAFQPHLAEGEQITHYAYGVKQPPIWLIIILMCLAILPGIIAVALLTKEYIVALTGSRFLVIRFSGGKVNVKEFIEYQLGEIRDVKTSKGAIFTVIKIKDEVKPFTAKFHRMGMKENREHSQAIADALAAQA